MTREDKLNEIANILDYWLRSHKLERDKQHIPTNDDTHIHSVPSSWPTRGTLKEWVKVLRNVG